MRRWLLLTPVLLLPLAAPAEGRASLDVVDRVTLSRPLPALAECVQDDFDREHAGQASEPAVALDPSREGRLVASWIQDASKAEPVVRSDDGGRTWTEPFAPILSGCTGRQSAPENVFDPQLAFTTDGTAVLAGVTVGRATPLPPGTPASRDVFVREIVVARSADGGATFESPTVLTSTETNELDLLDRVLLASDPATSGRVWAAWARVEQLGAQSRIEVSSSDDGGRTWSAPTDAVAPGAAFVFPTALVIRQGAPVLLVFEDPPAPAGVYTSQSTVLAVHSLERGGWRRLGEVTTAPIVSAASLAVDDDGALVVAFAPEGRLFTALSRDGHRWSLHEHEAGGSQVTVPTVATGHGHRTGLLWYARPSPSPALTQSLNAPDLVEVRVAESRDGGATFSPSVVVEGPFNLRDGPATNGAGSPNTLGDYFALARTGGAWLAVYGAVAGPGDGEQTGVIRAARVR